MIPTEPDADTPDSERYVFDRLRERLPDAWTVLHARRFFLPAREGRRAEEGEVDFVVIDPARGIVALEVKAGGIARTPDGWLQTGRDGVAHRVKDPGKQAQRAVRALDRYLREQPWFARNRRRVPFAWGVVLPDVDVRGALGPDLPRELVIAREDFADLRAALGRVFAASAIPAAALGDEEVAATIRALAPTLRLIRPLAARIQEEAPVLVRLTREQAQILDVFADMPRVAVSGAAGTGKTLLAMEWAARLAASGRRVLLLCFNRPLAEYLARQARGFEVHNFHRLCHDLCQRAGVPFEVPAQGPRQRDFWEREAPLCLLEALEKRPDARWDAVIVDEGQDFRADWWPAVEGLLAERERGSLVVFFDPNQDIYEGGPPRALQIAPARLRWNCRNTGRIARFAHAVIGSEAELRPGTPEGADVELVHVRSEQESIDEVRRVLHRLLVDEGLSRDQIVVLSTHSRERSPLARAGRLGNVTLCPLDVAAAPGQVRFGSLHQFKGLESDAVILTDVRAGDPNSSPRHIYVATSRARHLLVVVERVDATG
jgi:hypothetical protein